jgi:hypothetical protein
MFEILRIIFNMFSSERERSIFKQATEKDIAEALRRIKEEFSEEIAKRVEQIFRLETANFKSYIFKKTNAAGLLYNDKYFKHRDKICVYVKEIRDERGNLIRNKIVDSSDKDAKKYCYVVFDTVYEAMRYLALYLKRYGVDGGTARWGGSEKYLALVKKIQTKFV